MVMVRAMPKIHTGRFVGKSFQHRNQSRNSVIGGISRLLVILVKGKQKVNVIWHDHILFYTNIRIKAGNGENLCFNKIPVVGKFHYRRCQFVFLMDTTKDGQFVYGTKSNKIGSALRIIIIR